MSTYLDTSVLVSFLVQETDTDAVRDALRRGSTPYMISEWTVVEFHAALSFKVRTRQIAPVVKAQAEVAFEGVRNALYRVCSVVDLDFYRSAKIASSPGINIRAGDALHLAVCERLGYSVCTLDKAMLAAAQALKLPISSIAPRLE